MKSYKDLKDGKVPGKVSKFMKDLEALYIKHSLMLDTDECQQVVLCEIPKTWSAREAVGAIDCCNFRK